jgi:tRNA (guanine-N7-)-methyltransferase
MKGRWHKAYFDNDHPIVVELACGKGEYTVNLARAYPHKNFIGIDIKGNRIWKGARQALEEDLHNVAFVRTRIEQLPVFFAPGEIDEIWITFPDPFPRRSRAKKRLTSARFLDIYKKVLRAGGNIHLKTDDTNLFQFTLETLDEAGIEPNAVIWDVHSMDNPPEALQILTYYEQMHLAAQKKIKYLRFSLETDA